MTPSEPERGSQQVVALDGARLDGLELLLSGLLDGIDGYCLPGEKPPTWPFESTVEVPADTAGGAEAANGIVLTDPDGTPIARLTVTGTRASREGFVHVAGPLRAMQAAEHPPARDIRLTSGVDYRSSTVAIFSTGPDPADVVRAATAAGGGPLVFLAVTWNSGHADYGISATVDTLRRCAAEIPGASVRYLAIAPLNPALDAATVLSHILKGLQPMAVLDFTTARTSGPVTTASAPPAEGRVVLFTGLSGSGKSTIARALAERMASEGLGRCVLLDGDDVRRVLSAGLGFSAADREANLHRIGWVAAKISSVGGVAICAPIAPFERTRQVMRSMAEQSGRFVLVYVATPLEVCEQRDRKGLYARARAGEISDFTGIDSPYEAPADADLVLDTTTHGVDENVDAVLRLLGSLERTPPEGAG